MSLVPVLPDTWLQRLPRARRLGWISVLQLTGWLLAGGMLLLHFSLQSPSQGMDSVWLALLSTAILACLTTAAGLTYQRCLTWPVHCQVATMLVGSGVITLTAVSLVNLVTLQFSGAQTLTVRDNVSVFLMIVMTWSALYFVVSHGLLLLHRQRKASDSECLSHLAQLHALEQQLNPHFLFNTLNAISTQMLKRDIVAARHTLNQLADFLRQTLHVPHEKKSALDEELSVAMMYLDIEKTRFASRLNVSVNAAQQIGAARVPSLILLPLLVHAVNTAIARMTRGGQIAIQATRHNNLLHLQVEDNGPDAEIDQGRVTVNATDTEQITFRDAELQVVAQRLAVLYPRQHIFRIEKNQPTGMRVVMMIPYEEP